ncbi:MAG: hypothetical protein J6A39_08495 [Peptococcaceae bacterium]|nr:hypothetical protein [Peptococcaceae bacterium]
MGMRLHRDSEVGVISGDLEREGFYGEEIQLYGFAYLEEKLCVIVSEDELFVSFAFYNSCMKQKAISAFYVKSARIYGTEEEIAAEKKRFKIEFEQEIKKKGTSQLCTIPVDDEKIFPIQELENTISGFVYWDGHDKKCMVNGYFPQTVKWWFEKKSEGYQVENIQLLKKQQTAKITESLKNFKNELLQS